jgi:dihydrofolate synthase/folylpolyglutamate synthase
MSTIGVRDYADALRYIYGFADYERHTPRQREYQHLENVLALLEAVGNPHTRLRSIHIGGTKGKGSTAAMLTSVLIAAGRHVGTFSSPHLNTHRERYRLDGRPVGEGLFTETLRSLQPAIERVRAERPLTTFEVSTALAFTLFLRERVEWAVVEVGMGGRLDTTNVITPAVSVITSISLDHTQVLGDTVQQIAADKAGIIKPGVPVVIGAQQPEALTVLRERADALGSPALEVERLATARDRRVLSPSLQELTLDTRLSLGGELLDGCRVELNLQGAHQAENALTTTVALSSLDNADAGVRPEHLVKGLRRVEWPGRFEVIEGRVPVVLDGAHNPYSMRKLRLAVEEVFPGRRTCWVFGSGTGHDAAGMLRELRGLPVVLCRSTHPRSRSVEELAALAETEGVRHTVERSVLEAIETARRDAEVVVVCGTLFLVADAREALGLAGATDRVRS